MAIALSGLTLLFACDERDTYTSYSSTEKNGIASGSISLSNDSVSLEISYSGDIQLNEEGTAVKTISPEGFLKYKKNNKKFSAVSDKQGNITYELSDAGNSPEGDAARNTFIADALREMVVYGFNAKNRLPALYKKGGSAAVLREAAAARTDELRSSYLEFLLKIDSLQQSDLTLIAQMVAGKINGDVEKVKLLQLFRTGYMSDIQTANAALSIAESIHSGLEKTKALELILAQPIMTDEVVRALKINNTISGDLGKMDVLYFLAKKEHQPSEHWIALINATGQLSSELERAKVLEQIATKLPADEPTVKEAFRKVAGTITSPMIAEKVMGAVK
ncbi:hypothetical protein DF182_26185 [Chitinophaga flava]|uniref:Uncharacterized protein n=2 Tax=Chitinophaga flava TaxID=2259036 RepID=A0A365XWK3_9BACT|nr:hypothetical protein DF182_26185 [Chitinophaga flava]